MWVARKRRDVVARDKRFSPFRELPFEPAGKDDVVDEHVGKCVLMRRIRQLLRHEFWTDAEKFEQREIFLVGR